MNRINEWRVKLSAGWWLFKTRVRRYFGLF